MQSRAVAHLDILVLQLPQHICSALQLLLALLVHLLLLLGIELVMVQP